jgi:hypothetical protein
MINSFFFRIDLRVCFADALGNYLLVALPMAGVLAVYALHTSNIPKQVSA